MDKHPPGGGRRNEWHGAAPCHAEVVAGQPPDLAPYAGRTLLLVYPPPGSPFAEACLDHFSGRTVAHVGEWYGATGTAAFQRRLCREFHRVQTVPLPNFGDTCYALTVWQRRKGKEAEEEAEEEAPTSAAAGLLECSACGRGGAVLRRCRYSRAVQFCSRRCAEGAAGRARHRGALAERLVFFALGRDWGAKADFQIVAKEFRQPTRRGAGAEGAEGAEGAA